MRKVCILTLLLLAAPLGAQETDREILQRIQREIAAHLAGGVVTPPPPVQPPPPTESVSITRYETSDVGGPHHGITAAPGSMRSPTVIVTQNGTPVEGALVEWTRITGGPLKASSQRTNVNGASQVGWTLSQGDNRIRVCAATACVEFVANGTGGNEPQPPTVDPVTDNPPAPGPDASSWTGNTIPVRIIETRGVPGLPVAITITADGESRTFRRSSVGQGRTIHVPRNATLTVTAHVTPTASAGLGGYGFAGLKVKAMNSAWGFEPNQLTGTNSAAWEPFTNNAMPGQPDRVPGWVWGGSLTTFCGSMPPGHTGPWWQYSPPGWVTTRAGVDFLVVWILDHQFPRHTC